MYFVLKRERERERENARGTCMFLCAFLAFQVSLAVLATQAHIWALLKMVDVLDLKSLPPVAVTTGAAAIGCGVPSRVAVLAAAYAQWIGPCWRHHVTII